MANYAKYTRGAIGHVTRHYERAKDPDGNYIKFGNQQIDSSRTNLNYNLAPNQDQLHAIHKRLDEVYCMNRKDVNVMCSWVVTAPKDLDSQKERAFFQSTYQFLEKKYGQKNVISSYVHLDENTPHMHFCFIPVVQDKKKNREKVSAKECVTKKDLLNFHHELEKDLVGHGISCSMINNVTREGNKAIKQLKQESAIETLKNAHMELKRAQDDLNILRATENALKDKLERLEGKFLSLEEIEEIKIHRPLLGDKSIAQMSYQDAINLKTTALQSLDLKLQAEKESKLAEEKWILATRVEKSEQRKWITMTNQLSDYQKMEKNFLELKNDYSCLKKSINDCSVPTQVEIEDRYSLNKDPKSYYLKKQTRLKKLGINSEKNSVKKEREFER